MTVTSLESLAAILLWMTPFVMGKHLRLGSSITRRSLLSAARGISVAYVIVGILPQMDRMPEIVHTASLAYPGPFVGYQVHLLVLIGFITFYVLEKMVALSRLDRTTNSPKDDAPISWVHIVSFAFYSALVGYILQTETERALGSLVLYSLAMFCHFWLVDHFLRMDHGDLYDDSGRWVIAAAVLAGWTLGIAGVSSDLVLPTLMGFLSGGMLVNSLKEEPAGKREGRILPFVIGASGCALLLLLIGATEIMEGR
jgi:hypothetical protein